MTATEDCTSTEPTKAKSRVELLIEELAVDALITAAIVWSLVLLGEPLLHVLTSPLFVVLTAAGLIHLTAKTVRHDPQRGS